MLPFSGESLTSHFSKNVKIKLEKKNVILPVILYGCDILSLILSKLHRLRASENQLLRKISGPRREEI
jgi:hypothetical protein